MKNLSKVKISRLIVIFIIIVNLFFIKKNSQYISYNLKNKIILNVDETYKINEKIVVFSKNNKFGIMNYKGEIVIPNDFDEISTFIDKIFIGAKDSKYSLYNLKNKKVSDDYDFIEQIGNNEYKGGTNEKGNYAFLSEDISTKDKYKDIQKYNEIIYIGQLENNTSDIIEIKSKLIKNIKNDDIENILKNMKGLK